LDAVIVEWLHTIEPDGRVVRDSPEKENMVKRWVANNAPALKLLPLVNNYNPDAKRWEGDSAGAMLRSTEARARFASELLSYVSEGGYGGAILDLEALPGDAQAGHLALVQELGPVFAQRKLRLLVSVPASDPDYDYRALAAAADGLILTAYDEH